MRLRLGALLLTLSTMMKVQAIEPLDEWCRQTLEATAVEFAGKGLARADIAMSVATWPQGEAVEFGSASGNQLFYPASTCKLFFLAYGAHLQDEGKLNLTKEADRAFTDMIVESDNEATGAVVDLITGTTSGPELSPAELDEWLARRLVPTNWFLRRGYKGVYVPQKTFYSGPYGRERQGRGVEGERGNRLCTDAATRLMAEIMRGEISSEKSTNWMKSKLARSIPADSDKADSQSKDFIGGILPKGTKLWSKSGWTSTTRHDIAAIQLANGRIWVLSIFTQGEKNAANVAIIPSAAKRFLSLSAGRS